MTRYIVSVRYESQDGRQLFYRGLFDADATRQLVAECKAHGRQVDIREEGSRCAGCVGGCGDTCMRVP